MAHVGGILVLVVADDDRVGREVGEVEGEGVGALPQLLHQAALQLGLLAQLALVRGVDLHPDNTCNGIINLNPDTPLVTAPPVQDELLLEAEPHHLLLLLAVPEGDHQLRVDPPPLQRVVVVLGTDQSDTSIRII